MKRVMLAVAVIVAAAAPFAVGAPGDLVFDVASVKPIQLNGRGGYAVPRTTGGPGSPDPTRITYLNYDLKYLLLAAYELKPYQLSGPDWLDREQFVIEASIRPGATPEQVNQMLANLLAERFKITLHRETRNVSSYELLTIRKGPKLKESLKPGANDGAPLPAATGAAGFYGVGQEKDGFLRIPLNLPPIRPGTAILFSTPEGRNAVGGNQPIEALAAFLSAQLGRPVLDKTGLMGNWDYNLQFANPAGLADGAPEPGADLVTAVREQLGLKLESKKAPLETVVIDHMEKAPTGN